MVILYSGGLCKVPTSITMVRGEYRNAQKLFIPPKKKKKEILNE